MKHVYIIVRDGMVEEVMSDDKDIDVEVIDFDTDDEDCLEEAEERYDEIQEEHLHSIW